MYEAIRKQLVKNAIDAQLFEEHINPNTGAHGYQVAIGGTQDALKRLYGVVEDYKNSDEKSGYKVEYKGESFNVFINMHQDEKTQEYYGYLNLTPARKAIQFSIDEEIAF